MAEISAAQVNQLRNKTGLGMMECKKLLIESSGDVDKAIEIARKKGVKTSITERQAGEGKISVASSADGKTAVAVEVNTNTDFTAKSEVVQNALKTATQKLLANPSADVKNDPQIKDTLTSVAQQTGENVQIGRTAVMTAPNGKAGAYLYVNTGKIGVLMQFTGNPEAELITQVGGHIAFARPLGLTRAEVPADLVAKEREIAIEQAKATGKPQQIAEKIAEGKLNSFFAERVLLDQEFFNAMAFKGTVGNLLKSKGVTLEKYVRLEVGQS
ncbi:MAG TPA: translation elongation factor Ts [Tepidisphaeraceae bacterium]|jgi:elongation factor Ts